MMMMKEKIFTGHPSLALPHLHLALISLASLALALLALNPLAFAPLHSPLHRALEYRKTLKFPFVYLHMDLTLLAVVRGSGIYDFFS